MIRRRFAVLLAGSLVLTACGTPAVTETASPAALQLSEADIEATIQARSLKLSLHFLRRRTKLVDSERHQISPSGVCLPTSYLPMQHLILY